MSVRERAPSGVRPVAEVVETRLGNTCLSLSSQFWMRMTVQQEIGGNSKDKPDDE
jgi:hypothetical protein